MDTQTAFPRLHIEAVPKKLHPPYIARRGLLFIDRQIQYILNEPNNTPFCPLYGSFASTEEKQSSA